MPRFLPPGPNVGTQLAARRRAERARARAAGALPAASATAPPSVVDSVEAWFATQGWQPFDFQREVWQRVAAGESGLVHATTGTGKTYAIYGAALQQAVRQRAAGARGARGLTVLWITPMRALAADTARALRAPLAALGLDWQVGVRTGDTAAAERTRQARTPPQVLVTTPESLSLMLAHPDSPQRLGALGLVVIDEWHELIGGKRGVQVQLALARLRRFARGECGAAGTAGGVLPVWGLSATIGNLDHALDVLLAGAPGALVVGHSPKSLVVDTLLPHEPERFPWAGHLGIRMRDPVVREIEAASTTLVFTNVRSQAEAWYRALLEARPDWAGVLALHHGSLDREVRDWVELGLKEGRLKAVVATSSLDLGVDFLPVERVLQIGSPKGVARLLQRAGRSGHAPGRVSRATLVPTHTLELVEAAGARRAIAARRVEARCSPAKPLDVLVQHLVTVAAGTGFTAAGLLAEVRGTFAYRTLTDDEWDWALDFVGRGGAALRAYPEYRRVVQDEAGVFRVADRRTAARHRMSIGTIVADASLLVKMLNHRSLGAVEESFISRMKPGDVFQFAGRILELVRVRDMTAWVRPSKRRSGLIPRWAGARMALSSELADASLEVLEDAAGGRYDGPEMALARPLIELQARWSAVPTRATLLVELMSSREGHHLFVYPFAGRLAHIGIASLLAWRIGQVAPGTFSIAVNDYGFELLSPEPVDWAGAWDTRRDALLGDADLLADVLQSLNASELAQRRFREVARVAGLVFQGFPGAPKSVRQLQASSSLFYQVFRQHDAGNQLLAQAEREVLEQELEVGRLRTALARMRSQRLDLHRLARPSPFAFPLMVERFREQVSTEEVGARIERMLRELEAQAGLPEAPAAPIIGAR